MRRRRASVPTVDAEREAYELELARVVFEADGYVHPPAADDFWRMASVDEKRRCRAIGVAVERFVEARFEARIAELEARLAAAFTPANENEWRAGK